MTTIAISVDNQLKKQFSTNLKKEGLTAKAFFLYCMKAYNEKKLSFGIVHQDAFQQDIEVNEPLEDVLTYMKQSYERTKKTIGKTLTRI